MRAGRTTTDAWWALVGGDGSGLCGGLRGGRGGGHRRRRRHPARRRRTAGRRLHRPGLQPDSRRWPGRWAARSDSRARDPTGACIPRCARSIPPDGYTFVGRDTAVKVDVNLPNVGQGVAESTLTPANVQLIRTSDVMQVDATVNTTGGGDAIVLQPQGPARRPHRVPLPHHRGRHRPERGDVRSVHEPLLDRATSPTSTSTRATATRSSPRRSTTARRSAACCSVRTASSTPPRSTASSVAGPWRPTGPSPTSRAGTGWRGGR